MRTWLWILGGGILIVGGMVTALIGLFLLFIKDEGTRLFPYWIGSTILLGATLLIASSASSNLFKLDR